jgi:hypothetical protein
LRPRLAEALDRFRIEVPIDDAADREQWQDVAARDVLGADEPGEEREIKRAGP